jgi:hypothetical protein
MQTLERVIFIVVAIIVGAMLLNFIASNIFSIDEDEGFDGIDTLEQDEFAQEVLEFWDECAMGELNLNRTVYVKFSSAYGKAELFSDVKGIDLCRSLQSKDNGCGEYEHVDFTATYDKPKLVRLSCDDETKRMVIG